MADLNIVTFNIRCFGFDGDYFARGRSESRIPYLKEFIQTNYSDVDVFIFQEIMDTSILNLILPEGFKFYQYQHEYPRHMFVVLACKKDLDFTSVQIIQNSALDTTKSRPALYGKLVNKTKSIAHIIGLHLKSGFEHTEKRMQQCQVIADFIDQLEEKLPAVLAGDFNSHFKIKTKKEFDDLTYFKKIFDNRLALQEHNKKTYILPTEDAHLDHFWIAGCNLKKLEVYELENYSEANSLKNYYREISDHLTVKITLDLK
jgi:hypothetical protein